MFEKIKGMFSSEQEPEIPKSAKESESGSDQRERQEDVEVRALVESVKKIKADMARKNGVSLEESPGRSSYRAGRAVTSRELLSERNDVVQNLRSAGASADDIDLYKKAVKALGSATGLRRLEENENANLDAAVRERADDASRKEEIAENIASGVPGKHNPEGSFYGKSSGETRKEQRPFGEQE